LIAESLQGRHAFAGAMPTACSPEGAPARQTRGRSARDENFCGVRTAQGPLVSDWCSRTDNRQL